MRKAKPGRSTRIADQIARDIAELIPKEVRDPRVGFVTVTGCEITPDYAHANIYFTVIGSEPEACREGLNVGRHAPQPDFQAAAHPHGSDASFRV